MKKISLAIPTYFSSKYLSILLRSIRNSKFIDEVVISDDSKSNLEKSKIEKNNVYVCLQCGSKSLKILSITTISLN